MPNNTLENRIKLTPYYFAYMDILGAKKYIESEESENYLNKIQQLYAETIGMIKANDKILYHTDVKFKIFSDNIVIAIPKEIYMETSINEVSSYYIMMFASFFQILAIKHSFLVRGSIAVDDLYIDNDFVYGKALTKSYKLESEIAIYPRIIINPSDIHLFTKSDTQRDAIKKDNANIYYVNPFEFYFKYINQNIVDRELNSIKTNLQDMLHKTSNNKVNQKICWFINLFNDFCIKNEYNNYVINIDDYPYPYTKMEHTYRGYARGVLNEI